MLPEPCAACRFDGTEYTHDDLLGTLRALPPVWRSMTRGVAAAVLATPAQPNQWSALDAAAHTGRDLAAVAAQLGIEVDQEATAESPQSIDEALDPLAAVVASVNAHASRFTARDWREPVVVDGIERDAEWIVANAVHLGTHHVREAGRALHELGAGAPTQHGSVVQLSASNGGVPKAAISTATIGLRGVVGDHQAERNHHGRPLQAVCLWSQEVIDGLRAEGHPVYAGAAGENLTIRGIDWPTIRPGVRIAIGDDVVLDISAFATPCAKNAQWFSDRKFRRINHDEHPGSSRAYAWVVNDGSVAPGDRVIVEP